MLYTSGTTGWPKGVMLTQRSMTAHTRVVAPAYAMDESGVNVVAMPLFHVGGTSWALGSMSAGGRTIIVREPVPGALLGLIDPLGRPLSPMSVAGVRRRDMRRERRR